jgi:hypothetical protein
VERVLTHTRITAEGQMLKRKAKKKLENQNKK